MQNTPEMAKRMRTFWALWAGMLVSGIGTGLGSFALGVWIYEKTGSITLFATAGLIGMTTGLILTPLIGSVADRYDRRKIMLTSNLVSAVTAGIMAALLGTGNLQVWHIYPLVFVLGLSGMFQGPAMGATVSLLVPRHQLVRMSGLFQTVGSVIQIVMPLIAGVLVGAIGYHYVIAIDVTTFLVAAAVLFTLKFPRVPVSAGTVVHRSVFHDTLFGWNYIRERKGLLALLFLFALTSVSLGIVTVLLTPLILSFATPTELGSVSSAGAAGTMLGAMILAAWGGPKVRVWGIFGALIIQGSILLLGGLQPSIPLIAISAFIFMSTGPFVAGASQAIWQSKVSLDIQGRVFAIRQMVTMTAAPIAYAVAGPLADGVFEPLLAPGGALAGSVGQVIGVGEGRGVGFLFMVLGVFIMILTCLFFLNPRLRHVESELPDARRDDGSEDQPVAQPGAPEGAPGFQGA